MAMKFYITQETKQEIEAKIDVLEDKFLSISDSFTAMENQGKIYMLKEILLLSTILPVDSWQNVKDMLDINTLPINYYKGIIIESKK
jgi:hypothetical protein